MASISFYSGEDFAISNLSSSGLGFFGAGGFGKSVEVGAFNDSTFITDGNGTIQGPQCDNIKRVHPNSGVVNGAGPYDLTHIPNYLATLNIRFEHSSAVKTQNGEVRIYDRSNINNAASGVSTYAAEIIHGNTSIAAGGSGDITWVGPLFGSGSILDLVDSPGTSGDSPNGSSTTDTRHDHYIAISASPDSVGSKNLYSLYASFEYI
jgi:hypothetical protein